MYEPIRTKSVHTMAAAPEVPHRSREEELDIRLAGQLTALLTVTDELHALATREDGGAAHGATPDGAALAAAAERIADQVARLSGGHYPCAPSPPTAAARPTPRPAAARPHPRRERPGGRHLPRGRRGDGPGRGADGGTRRTASRPGSRHGMRPGPARTPPTRARAGPVSPHRPNGAARLPHRGR